MTTDKLQPIIKCHDGHTEGNKHCRKSVSWEYRRMSN